VAEAELKASGGGRVLVRPSGTEDLVRVMVEAATEQQAHAVATQLSAMISELLGK
jgi:phosphoglucosamine mutase